MRRQKRLPENKELSEDPRRSIKHSERCACASVCLCVREIKQKVRNVYLLFK